MRTPIYALIAALVLGGCTHYHVTPAGAPRPDRVEAPEPDPIEPLELDIGRPAGSHLLLQTSRPAYVAIFEIVPNRGVTLIYPAAVHQQNMLVSGLTWVPLWWSPRRPAFNEDRYIYAVASEEPLRLTGETFQAGYFSRVLGLPVYRAASPYATMRAISNSIVPNVADEEWAEDARVLTPTYHTETYRMARIHCAGGRVFEVPEDMVSRVWCPTRTRVVIVDASRPRARGDYPVGRPTRPDSIFGQGGTRVRLEPRRPVRGPVRRVVDPSLRDRDDRNDRGRRPDPRRAGRDARDDRNDRNDQNEDTGKPDKPRRGSVADLIREEQERKKQEQERAKEERERQRQREAEEREREKAERERQRREAEEARRREADERRNERTDRRNEREERKDERREEPRNEPSQDPKQQGQDKREEKKDEKQEEKREEARDQGKRRANVKDVLEQAKKEREEREKKEKEKKGKP